MPMGRPCKPTAIKIREGKPGHRPLPKNEPKPPIMLSHEPPDWLCPIAATEWRRLAAELDAQNLLTSWDHAAFASYCEAFGKYVRLTKQIEREGRILTAPQSGYKMPHPACSLQKQAREAMVSIGSRFGLNPSARAGLDISKAGTKPEDRRSEADKDFGRRTGT